jgi:formamidopyrimidine-DNA glycosylase
MPELPEVEFTARQLRATIIGATMRDTQVFWARTIGHPDLAQFFAEIAGLRVVGVRRRAKYILLDLTSRPEPDDRPDFLLTLHRRMTGNLYLLPPGWVIDTGLRESDPVLWNV